MFVLTMYFPAQVLERYSLDEKLTFFLFSPQAQEWYIYNQFLLNSSLLKTILLIFSYPAILFTHNTHNIYQQPNHHHAVTWTLNKSCIQY